MTPNLRDDLALIGYDLEASAEGCRCELCRRLDLRFDVDALATGRDGLPVFISYRAQPEWDWRTITIRWSNDKGNDDVQLAKLLDHRSRADLYVQGYPSGVAYAPVSRLLAGLRSGQTKACPEHRPADRGSGNQTFVIACGSCAGVIYVPRTGTDPFDDLPF